MSSILRRHFVAGLAATAVVVAAPSFADTWELLGKRKVRLAFDYDVIPVTFLRGNFSRLLIKVAGKGVFFNEVAVVYGNGVVDRIPIRFFIEAGGQSRVIDLRGRDRIIKSVQLFYRSVPTSLQRATVSVYAR